MFHMNEGLQWSSSGNKILLFILNKIGKKKQINYLQDFPHTTQLLRKTKHSVMNRFT